MATIRYAHAQRAAVGSSPPVTFIAYYPAVASCDSRRRLVVRSRADAQPYLSARLSPTVREVDGMLAGKFVTRSRHQIGIRDAQQLLLTSARALIAEQDCKVDGGAVQHGLELRALSFRNVKTYAGVLCL